MLAHWRLDCPGAVVNAGNVVRKRTMPALLGLSAAALTP